MLASRNILARLYEHQQRYADAERIYVENLSISERVLGLQHPWTLVLRETFGRFYMERDRKSEAEPLIAETVKVRERILGPDHPDTLSSRIYLALLLSWQI
jgi:Tetratricopeptide repeat